MNPRNVERQLQQAIFVLLFAGGDMSRFEAERLLREAKLEVGVPALLRRGLVHQPDYYRVQLTGKAKARVLA